MSVRPHVTTRLTLNGFSWRLIFEYFSKICLEKPSWIKIWLYFTWRPKCVFYLISPNSCYNENVAKKCCWENRHTPFIYNSFFFRRSCILWDNVEKYCTAGQATDGNMEHAHHMPKFTDTHSEYIILIAFPMQQRLYEQALILHYMCIWGWVGPSKQNCCVLTDPPTIICIKHNGDEEPEDYMCIPCLLYILLQGRKHCPLLYEPLVQNHNIA
jgi:hypothetical protein